MKKLVRVGLIMAGVAGVALGGGVWWVKGQLSREAVERQLQAVCGGRVSLGASELEVWGSPTRWRLRDLKVFATVGRDGKAEVPTEPVLSLREAVLEVSLGSLMSGTLDVQRLNLDGLTVDEYVSPDGVSDLKLVMAKPKGVAEPKVEVVKEEAEPKVEKVEKTRAAEFKAEQLGFTLRVREARVSNGQLFIHNRVNKTKTRLEGLQFALTDIDVDPNLLKEHNSVKMSLAMRLTLEGRGKVAGEMKDVTFAKVEVSGDGALQPFEEITGVWSPVSEWELKLAKGSVLAGYMTMGEASADAAKKMKEYGLDLSDMTMGGELLEAAVLKMAFSDNRLLVREDARFQMPDYEVRMAKGSWLNSAKDEQDLVIRLVCGEELQKRLREGMLKSGLPEKMADSVIKAFLDEASGRLSFDMRASGRVTRPDLKPAWDKALERAIQGGALEGLLKSLGK